MIFGWLRRRRRRKLLAKPFPAAWPAVLEALPFYSRLDDQERARLRDIVRVIVAEKSWEGADDLEITDEIRVTIAAGAALLLLGIHHDYFRRVTSIVVHPSTYSSAVGYSHRSGVVEEGMPVLGQAVYRGPVLLAWNSVQQGLLNPEDGRNVVIHEFAHRLDMLDGFVDGTPPLASRGAYAAWTRIMTEEYERLKRGRRSVLDHYGATNEGEFYAVACEAFFEKPLQMSRKHPQLYELLKDYFGQDPLARLRRAEGDDELP